LAARRGETDANSYPAAGNECKATEGAVTQNECPAEEPQLAALCAFIDSVKTRAMPRADA
jgi:hypothetical protein